MKPAHTVLAILRRFVGLLLLGLALPPQAFAQTNAPPTVSITKPAAGANYTVPANMTLVAEAAASDGGGISKVEFYNGATRIGTATAAPYLIAWNNVAAGTYTVTAKAYDDRNASTVSSAVVITVSQNQSAPPTVSITKPAAGANYTAPANMTLVAEAAASDGGGISKVEFYNGATRIGTATAAPYLIAWNNVAAGTYTVTAKAYDDRNASTVSSAVVITVGQNAMPTISLSSPPANSTAAAPATLALAATTTGSVTKVEFYSGQTLIGTATTPPYTLVWNNVPAGDYTLTAIASNDQGQQVTSPPISVSVIANQPLTIALTSPTPGQSFTLPTTVNLLAEAAGPDNGIAKVEFFAGTTLIGTVLTPPYSHAWENVPAGTYVITARATDALGAQTTTAPITITVANTVTKPSVVYLHVDHLNTPKLATDEQGKIIWRNSPLTEPFGNSPVEEDPDNDGIPFTLNLRFPGQYFDQETNTHYNYFRDYDPLTGRYIQSDPIGLAGGINTYAYVGGNPLSKIDPTGLVGWNGTMGGFAIVDGAGAGFFGFDLTSECKCGRKVRIKGYVSTLAAGLGLKYTGSGSGASFHDTRPCPEADIANGFAFMTSASSVVGAGASWSKVKLGGLMSDPPRLSGPVYGADISVGVYAGASVVTSVEIIPCNECEAK